MTSYHNKFSAFLYPNFEWADEDRKIVKGDVPESLGLQFHKKMPKGAALRDLQNQHLHLAYWETKYYKEALRQFICLDNINEKVVADIGCGDGRFTNYLIEIGFDKIIATDIDIRPLQNLADFLSETGNRDKVLLINSSVENLPLQDNVSDIVLCVGVLYYLNDRYEIGLKEALRTLKKGGIFINSEPDLEGAIYKSVFFGNLDDVYENYFERKFKEEKGKTPFKFRVFTEGEVIEVLDRNGQTVTDRYGLSLLPSIVRIMMVRGLIDEDELTNTEIRMRKVMDYLNSSGKLNKHIVWKSIKCSSLG